MRKILIMFMTAVLLVLLIFAVIEGYNTKSVKILSYSQIGKKSSDLEIYANAFDTRDKNEIKQKEEELKSIIQDYNSKKSLYEELMIEKRNSDADIANVLDIDFLLVKVGNYASDNNLDLKFDITKNLTDGEAAEYILTDLNFEVFGEYIAIADYISSLENDSRLAFEIRDFKIVGVDIDDKLIGEEGEGTRATFKVYSVGISKATLGNLNTQQNENNTTNTANPTEPTSANNTVNQVN